MITKIWNFIFECGRFKDELYNEIIIKRLSDVTKNIKYQILPELTNIFDFLRENRNLNTILILQFFENLAIYVPDGFSSYFPLISVKLLEYLDIKMEYREVKIKVRK